MNKLKKRILLCGILTAFATANVFVAISNEKQKALFRMEKAEAQGIGVVTWEILYEMWERFSQYNNPEVYKFNTRRGLTCAPVQIFSGKYEYGSAQAQSLDTHLGLNGSGSYASGNVNGSADASFQAYKSAVNNYQYEYSVNIVLDGNNWMVKTCEPCSTSDPEMIGSNCSTYNECADVIRSSADAYRSALGII